MSDTPRTDAYNPNPESKWRGFAQRLEQELRAVIAERDALKHDIEQYVRRDTERLKQLAAAITERDAERDRSSDLLLQRENVMEQLAVAIAERDEARVNADEVFKQLQTELADKDLLRKRLAAAEADARRYRWLRADPEGFEITVCETDEDGRETWVSGYPATELDAVIDAALAREAKP